MKSSDELADRIYEEQMPLRYVPSVHLLNAFAHLLFRVGRKFDKRKVPFTNLLPTHAEFVDKETVEIIIPIFGASERLKDCLDSISSSVGVAVRVIVVNNGVPSKVTKLVKSYDFVDCIIENQENEGFGGACNIGMEKVSTDFPILLNSDIVLKPDTLRLMIDVMESQPKIGICASVLVDEYGRYEESGRVLTKQGNSIAINGTQRFRLGVDHGISIVPYASFACVSIRKSAFDQTDGFDPIFWPAYSEDLDLAIQFFQLGYVSAISLGSVALHIQGSSTKELEHLDQIKEKNRVALLNKHSKFFEKVPYVEHDEVRTHRILRAISVHRDSVLVITNERSFSINHLAEMLECDIDHLVTQYVAVVCVDEYHVPIDFSDDAKLVFQNYGIDFFDASQGSLELWFRDRICVFERVVKSQIGQSFGSSEIFTLIKASQPELDI